MGGIGSQSLTDGAVEASLTLLFMIIKELSALRMLFIPRVGLALARTLQLVFVRVFSQGRIDPILSCIVPVSLTRAVMSTSALHLLRAPNNCGGI